MTMTTEETNVEPTETQNTDEGAEKPEVATPEPGQEEAAEEVKAEEDDRDKTLRRMERRINQKHAQAAAAAEREKMARAETEQLRQKLAQYEAPQEKPHEEADPVALAREIVQIERVTEKANGVAKDGEKRFTGFKESVLAVTEEAGPLFDQKGKSTALGEAILDADDPAALLHHLGSNPDLASELQGLTPAQLGRRLGRIEAEMSTKPKPLSKAPAPERPLAANVSDKNPANMSFAEYKAARKAQGASWAR